MIATGAVTPPMGSRLEQFGQLQVLTRSHLPEVARAFVTIAPDYFLSRFGARYLERVFWPAFCDAPGCFGFVWVDAGQVVGFAAGTLRRERFIGDVIRRAPAAFATRLAIAAARRPSLLVDAFGLATRLGTERARGGPDAELISLGVLPRALRPAAGSDGRPLSPALVLMAASAQHMAQNGADAFRLYTGATNRLACAFYRRLGFREAYRFGMFGEEKVCFIGDVAAPGLSL